MGLLAGHCELGDSLSRAQIVETDGPVRGADQQNVAGPVEVEDTHRLIDVQAGERIVHTSGQKAYKTVFAGDRQLLAGAVEAQRGWPGVKVRPGCRRLAGRPRPIVGSE